MTYAKRLSEIGERVLASHLPSIKKLKEGASYLIEGPPSGLSSFRYYLYTWIDLNEMRGRFRVGVIGPGKLKITRREVAELRGRHLSPLTDVEEFVIERLGEIDDSEKVREILELAVGEKEIREEDVEEIWKEWKSG